MMVALRGLRQRSRRDAYLTVWGVAYFALAMMVSVSTGPLWPIWLVSFGGAAVLCAAAAILPYPWLQVSAFVGLTTAAALRATWHVFLAITTNEPIGGHILAFTLWIAVTAGQVVVAGWPLDRDAVSRETP